MKLNINENEFIKEAMDKTFTKALMKLAKNI